MSVQSADISMMMLKKLCFFGFIGVMGVSLCGAGKSAFTTEQKTEVSETKLSPIQADEDMKKLSAGEFSALCSNLARGCEKQYKEAEAELFHEIADYFAEVTAL